MLSVCLSVCLCVRMCVWVFIRVEQIVPVAHRLVILHAQIY